MIKFKILLVSLVTLVSGLGFVAATETSADAVYDNVDGCGGPGDVALYRQDDFWRGLSSVQSGIGAEPATYRVTWHTRYWYCRQINDPNKIRIDQKKICAEKTNDRDPNSSFPLRGFEVSAVYDTLANIDDPNFIDVGPVRLDWNGRGNDGDKKCTSWTVITNSAVRWLGMGSTPYMTAAGYADIGFARDDHFDFYDVDNGTRFHYFHPESDPDVAR